MKKRLFSFFFFKASGQSDWLHTPTRAPATRKWAQRDANHEAPDPEQAHKEEEEEEKKSGGKEDEFMSCIKDDIQSEQILGARLNLSES